MSQRSSGVAGSRVVLIVEDDPAIQLLCRVTLERALTGPISGLRVVVASDLAAARRLIASEHPDVIVLDVRLPDGNGLDLARELRGQILSGGPRVIIASASVLPAERDEALAAGAQVFLAKPYRPVDLVASVDGLLRVA